jgi:hypothetical protein
MARCFITTTLFYLAITCVSLAQEPLSYQENMEKAGESFETQDWRALNTYLDAAQEIRPYSLYIWKNRILARQLAGDTPGAIALADTIAKRGLSMNVAGHEALDALSAEPDFAPIAARMKANLAPIGDDAVLSTHDNNELLPEAFAIGRKDSAYFGSVRTGQILRVSKTGAWAGITFAPGGVFDIEVRGGKLWAAVNNQLAYENADPESKYAAFMQFDVKNGALIHDIRIGDSDALIGDIELAKDGTLYGSDSITPRLFILKPGGKDASIFATDARFANLQGIALDEKKHRLFLADYLTGLFVVDTKTGAVTAIGNPSDAHLGGIDGLYYYKGDLIGIQNGTTPLRIIKIGLKDNQAVSLTVLAQNLTQWNEPTHGVIHGRNFQYIATSNWPSYDAEWKVREDTPPQPLRIMAVELD